MLRTAATAVFVLLCAAPAARAADAPTWTVEPTAGGGRPYVYMEGVPGTVLEDRLSVTNRSTDPLTVRFQHSNSAATWLTLATTRLTVPPRTRAEIPFSVTVPADALPGDHPAAITAASGGREASVRIRLRVGGPTLGALTVEDVSVSGDAIRYSLVNRGNTPLTPSITIRTDGFFGRPLHHRSHGQPPELLPGRRVTLTEKWPNRPSLDAVDVHIRATAPGAPPSEATTSATFVPWRTAALAAALLVAAAVPARRLLRRRDASPARPRPPDAVDAPEGPGNVRHAARSGA
ncbi:hypothetical protein ACIHCQ_20325 [Streptomyces sp. NPDC052236]|uniref:hypothetical protein n=1 Tax=Streptomyces sp. NPDC052236 TaxID=3365686 RepID=UPI0037D72795